MARLATQGGYDGYWRSGNGDIPFVIPADAGLPVVALVQYASIAPAAVAQKARDAVRRSLEFELCIAGDTNNPLGYARQLVRLANGPVVVKFSFPHGAAGTCWQGEDARLASLAVAACVAAPLVADDTAFESKPQRYAWNQLHWMLGPNPCSTSVLMGSGQLNGQYLFFDSPECTNAPGAIVNGITSGLNDDGNGIAFDLGHAQTGRDDNWRWTAQWLPRAAWYMYAVGLPHR